MDQFNNYTELTKKELMNIDGGWSLLGGVLGAIGGAISAAISSGGNPFIIIGGAVLGGIYGAYTNSKTLTIRGSFINFGGSRGRGGRGR